MVSAIYYLDSSVGLLPPDSTSEQTAPFERVKKIGAQLKNWVQQMRSDTKTLTYACLHPRCPTSAKVATALTILCVPLPMAPMGIFLAKKLIPEAVWISAEAIADGDHQGKLTRNKCITAALAGMYIYTSFKAVQLGYTWLKS